VKIEGDIDSINGGLGVIVAIFYCLDYNIRAPIPFYVDTGCSRTTLGQVDALNAKVPFEKLNESKRSVRTGNGEVFPHIIHSCSVVFEQNQTSIFEYVGDMFVSRLEQPDTVSTLGLDVLDKYRVSFDIGRKKVILER
jgi:hypothetical protein